MINLIHANDAQLLFLYVKYPLELIAVTPFQMSYMLKWVVILCTTNVLIMFIFGAVGLRLL